MNPVPEVMDAPKQIELNFDYLKQNDNGDY